MIKQFKVLHNAYFVNRGIFRLWPTMFGKLQNCVINLTTQSRVNHLDLAFGNPEHGSFQSLAAELDLKSSDYYIDILTSYKILLSKHYSVQLLPTLLLICVC